MSFAEFFLYYVILEVGLAYRLSDLIACAFLVLSVMVKIYFRVPSRVG
jgi:hypothetical protein